MGRRHRRKRSQLPPWREEQLVRERQYSQRLDPLRKGTRDQGPAQGDQEPMSDRTRELYDALRHDLGP